MGCIGSKSAVEDQKKKPPDDDEVVKDASMAEQDVADVAVAAPWADENPSSRGPLVGFRHTSGLRVGVIESKETSVTLLNDYIVLGALGKGTYGSVKLCYSMQDDNLYALKVLQKAQLKRQMLGPRPSSNNVPALDMLRREVDVMRSMNHPNLIKIFEVIEADSKVVLVQEYAEAGPLQQPDHVMCESLAQYYFRQIVAGLHCLHAQNVVHGDMKPDNVLLSGSGLVKIADFGQAQFFNEGADVFDKTLGTPAFMAPEMRSGDAYHAKPADMWALGITLYCFVFGDLPFKGASLDELYTAIQRQEVQYPANTPISDGLRSVLDGLLSKDPARRPSSLELLHHPWVAEPEEGRQAVGLDEPLELTRMDDAPSLEKWMNDLAVEEPQPVGRLPLANEVAISVFGRGMLENAEPITAQNIMGVIQESNTEASAFPLLSGMTGADAPWGDPSLRSSTLRGSDSGAVADAWMAEQQLGSAAASDSQPLENGGAVRGLDPTAAGAAPGSQGSAERLDSQDSSPMEQMAAALDSLLGRMSLGDEVSLADLAVQQGQPAQAAADAGAAAGGAAGGAAAPAAAAGDERRGDRRSRFHEPVAAEQTMPSGRQQPSLTPFAAPGAVGRFGGSSKARLGSTSSGRPSWQPSGQAHSSPLSIPGAALTSLPISPFESNPVGSASMPDGAHSLPLGHHLSLQAPHSERDAPSLERASMAGNLVAAGGRRLESTGEVWDAMRSKALRNKVPGVKFVQFPAGAELTIPEKATGNYCLLIESGIIDLRYVAVLPYNLSQQAQPPSGASRASGTSGASSDSDDEEGRLERRDSVARGPEAQAYAPSKKHRGLAPSPSLQDTVDRVLARAQRVLSSALSNSETNMLSTTRGPNDFLGISSMLDPAQHKKLYTRWKAFFVARTEVHAVVLSRQAVELVLQHYPLAQVYLRLTLSKGRAEILQLESLENIASCLRPSASPSRKRAPLHSPSSRLDLFRAISFARKLAATMADQVTNIDPAGHVADAAGHVAGAATGAAGHLTDAASRVPRFFHPDSFQSASTASTGGADSRRSPDSWRSSLGPMPPLWRKSGLARQSGRKPAS